MSMESLMKGWSDHFEIFLAYGIFKKNVVRRR